MVSFERIGYLPPQDNSQNDNQQTETAYADGRDDGEVIIVHSLALRRFNLFAIRLEFNLKEN